MSDHCSIIHAKGICLLSMVINAAGNTIVVVINAADNTIVVVINAADNTIVASGNQCS